MDCFAAWRYISLHKQIVEYNLFFRKRQFVFQIFFSSFIRNCIHFSPKFAYICLSTTSVEISDQLRYLVFCFPCSFHSMCTYQYSLIYGVMFYVKWTKQKLGHQMALCRNLVFEFNIFNKRLRISFFYLSFSLFHPLIHFDFMLCRRMFVPAHGLWGESDIYIDTIN